MAAKQERGHEGFGCVYAFAVVFFILLSRIESCGQREHQQILQEGREALKKKDYGRAIDRLTEALRRQPKAAAVLLDRGDAYFEQGELTKAIADYDAALDLRPADWLAGRAHQRRGSAYLRTRDYDRALADVTQAIRLGRNPAQDFRLRGRIHARRGDTDNAIADYRQAVQLGPGQEAVKQELATLHYTRALQRYQQGGQRDRVIADLSRAIELDRGYAEAYLLRSIAYFAQGDRARSEADRREALRLNPALDPLRER